MSGKQRQVNGHITLEITFGSRASNRVIEVKYLIVDTIPPYNIILPRFSLNMIGKVLSTVHLSLKYLIPNGLVGTVRGGDQPRVLPK